VVPDLGSKALTLSSLIVGERKTDSANQPSTQDEPEEGKTASALRQVSLNVDHHFASSSLLRFLTFIYNASGAASAAATPLPPSASGITVPASSISEPANRSRPGGTGPLFRDNEPVVTAPLHKIQVEANSHSAPPSLCRRGFAGGVAAWSISADGSLWMRREVAKASAAQKFGFSGD